jgi:hypothetical protein
MVLLFFSVLGGWALTVINFYLAHQMLFNSILVAYGLLLGASHYTMTSLDRHLCGRLKTEDGVVVLRALAGPDGEELLREARENFRFPLISSGVDFAFHSPRRDSLIRLLGRKYRIPRADIAALLSARTDPTE